MANRYRVVDPNKPDLRQTQSSTQDDPILNKAKQVRRDTDNVKNISIGLYDIDLAFKDFLERDVKPMVEENGQLVQIPVMYSNPEKWKSAQRDLFMRDDNGMILTPVIVFKRNSLSPNTDMAKLKVINAEDASQMFERTYTKDNRYDQFSVLTNQKPSKEYYSVEKPDYVNIEYSTIVWCDYQEQVNKIVEQIVFFQGRSFGDRYKFVVKADSYTFETLQEVGEDRIVKSEITLQVKAYLLPEFAGIQNNTRKTYSVGKIIFNESYDL